MQEFREGVEQTKAAFVAPELGSAVLKPGPLLGCQHCKRSTSSQAPRMRSSWACILSPLSL